MGSFSNHELIFPSIGPSLIPQNTVRPTLSPSFSPLTWQVWTPLCPPERTIDPRQGVIPGMDWPTAADLSPTTLGGPCLTPNPEWRYTFPNTQFSFFLPCIEMSGLLFLPLLSPALDCFEILSFLPSGPLKLCFRRFSGSYPWNVLCFLPFLRDFFPCFPTHVARNIWCRVIPVPLS